ncbi:MAG: penicillin-binding protein 2 [Thermodesulfobacteriota bacterium]
MRGAFSTVALIVLFLAGLLFLRLWFLQMVEGEELRQRSENNRLRLQDLPPWRGMILDRNKEVLVANRPSYDLIEVMEDVTDIPPLARRLGKLLHLDPDQVTTQLESARAAGLSQVRIKGDLTWEEMAQVETFQPELPGALIQVQSKREYRQKGRACHVLGYLGEISENQLKSGRYPNYKMGDSLGKCGIEAAWEGFLRGKRGYRRIEVDAYGRELGQLDHLFPTPGANIVLTIDNRLQQEAENCLEDKAGAIVALDPRSGKILAMASSPPYSQEAFERGLTSYEWQVLSQRKDHPLENRCIKGQYPPGSTFKIVMAVAALEEKVITPATTFQCTGELPSGKHIFHCWRKGGHGTVNLYRGLVESCDVYFYQLGRRLGIERMAKWCQLFGLGVPTGIRLDREMPGLIGNPAWKLARFRYSWQEGDTLSMAIGQGYNLVTPLQLARMTEAIANGGQIFEPQLVARVESPAGEVLYEAPTTPKSLLNISPATLAVVRKALRGVVHDDGGTGKGARIPGIEVAGKTGTAQVVTLEKEKRDKERWGKVTHHYQNHAWFVAFAPVDDPEIAVAVLVEHGGGGGAVAAPLARRILAAYFPEPVQAPVEAPQEEAEEDQVE